MIKKIISFVVIIVMGLVIFSACVDYGYAFHFSVVGENGTIVNRRWDTSASVWRERTSPVFVLGGKKASKDYQYQLELTAIPDDGYQVKEWICDGKIIEGNKSNTFIAISADYIHFESTTTVEFELIQQ